MSGELGSRALDQNDEVTTRELLEQSDDLMRASRRLMADIDAVLAKDTADNANRSGTGTGKDAEGGGRRGRRRGELADRGDLDRSRDRWDRWG